MPPAAQPGDAANWSQADWRALAARVAELVQAFGQSVPRAEGRPVVVLMSGLPGTGKSNMSARLAPLLPAAVVNSDRVRKTLFPAPTYGSRESYITHQTCHRVIRGLLRQGLNVVYDATNLVEYHRKMVYDLAEREGAAIFVVRTVAPEEVVYQRLTGRAYSRKAEDLSDAGWEVYLSMSRTAENRFACPVIVVDTSKDVRPAVKRIVAMARELSRPAPRIEDSAEPTTA